jgi:4-carboxymuconolactone decarboxylase
MTYRFPSVPSSDLSDPQRQANEEAERTVRAAFGSSFSLTDSNGALLGPFAVLTYTPNSFVPYLHHTASVLLTSLFSPRERELATLAVCSVTKAEYVRYAHVKIGIAVGFSKEQADGAVEGRMELGLEGREMLVYELALVMAKNYGRLSDEAWERGRTVLGRDGMAALSQIVASYLHSSVLVNLAQIKVPGDGVEK